MAGEDMSTLEQGALDLSRLSPRDAIVDDEELFAAYESQISFFGSEAQRLRINIYIIEQVLRFPFGLFRYLGEHWFFSTVRSNCFDVTLLIATRLLHDKGGDVCTLRSFKNRMMSSLVRPEYRAALALELGRVKFDNTIEDSIGKAASIRNGRIAHTRRDFLDATEDDSTRFLLGELWGLRDGLISLVETLSFNAHHCCGPAGYDPSISNPPGADQRTDLERLLDSIAYQSEVLHYPEQQSRFWPAMRRNYTEEQLQDLNRYRAKFALPEA